MAHTCHAAKCKRVVPPERFMCRQHWYMLTNTLRSKIWGSYRNGQCDDWKISKAYASAARECIKFVAKIENVELTDESPELKLYEVLTNETDL